MSGCLGLSKCPLQIILRAQSHLPVHVDACLGEHEVPQVHEGGAAGDGGEAVVHEHDAVGAPQRHEDHHDHEQHLDDLEKK